MNDFTFCLHDIARLVLTLGALALFLTSWTAFMLLMNRAATRKDTP